jgi:hypothetical protein
MVMINGEEFREIKIKDSYNRRALQFKNNIIKSLKVFGLTEDDVEVPLEKIPMKKAQAMASWWMIDDHFFFSYNGAAKFVENLAMVAKVIEHFAYLLEENKITKEKFKELFAEDQDILKQRKKARTVLGVEEHEGDFDLIHKNYKKLAREHHPDMPGGNAEKFKDVNNAHKLLRKELG